MLDEYGVYDPTDYDLEEERAQARAEDRSNNTGENNHG